MSGQNASSFILADETGRTQLGLVKDGDIDVALQRARDMAQILKQTVLVYSAVHVATFTPSAAGSDPTDKLQKLR